MKNSLQTGCLASRMVLLMEFLEAIPLHPRIDLGRGDIRVSEQRLHHPKIRASL